MFIGHLGVAFGASAAEPRLRLGTTFVAAQLPDAIWPVLVLAATLFVHLGNLFGPPPPSTTAVTFSALLLIPLLWWWGNRVDCAARAAR